MPPFFNPIIKHIWYPFTCLKCLDPTVMKNSLIYNSLVILSRLKVVGQSSVREQRSLLKGPWGQTGVRAQAAWVCMLTASGREWEMVMKELIASSGFWNRTPAPSAWAWQHANGILMTMAKIRENDPTIWSIWKPQICAERVSTGNTFPLFFMDSYTLTVGLILLRCTNITLYQFAPSIIHSNNVILTVFTPPQQLFNYITIINTHMESQTYHRLVSFYFRISI